MKPNKTSITVSIDLADPHEKRLFDYVMSKGTRKKSGYIKRLIHADMVGVSEPVTPVYKEIDNELDTEDVEAMKGFI